VSAADQGGGKEQPFRMARVGRHGMVYAVGILLSKAVAFLMLPIYTRFLTPGDYGVLQLIIVVHEVTSLVAGSRIAQGVFHFYHKAEDDIGRRRVVSTALVLLTATFAVVAVVAYALAPPIGAIVFDSQEYNNLIRISAITLAFEPMITVGTMYLQLLDKSKLFVVMSTSKLFLQVLCNVIFLIPFHMGAKGVVLSTMIANIAVGLWVAWYTTRRVGMHLERRAVRDLVRFGIPLVATQIATFISTFGDRYFLNQSGNTDVVGLYGLAYQFGFLLVVVGFFPFSRVWDPVRFEIARRDDRDELYARGFVYMNLVLVTVGVLIGVLADDFLRVIAAPAFRSAALLVPFILVAYGAQAWTDFLNLGVLYRERTEWITVANWVAAAVAVVGYLVLIPRYLGIGAALATVAAFAVRCWMVYYFAQRLWPVAYRWGPVWRLVGAGLGAIGIGMLAPELPVVASLAFRTVLLAAYGGAVWSFGVLTDADRRMIRLAIRQPRAVLAGLRR